MLARYVLYFISNASFHRVSVVGVLAGFSVLHTRGLEGCW